MNDEKRDFDSEALTRDKEPARVKLSNDVVQAICGLISLTSDMNVLDFGCGTGLLTLQIQPFVRSITGIDSSQGMLNVLDAKISKLGITNVRTHLFDIIRGVLPFGEFDLVVSSMTFHHIKDVSLLLKAMAGVIHSSGQIVIIDLDPDDGKFHDSNEGVFHFGFERSIMKKLLEEAGYDSIREKTAASMQRVSPTGETRGFSIFIMVGRKST
ncbi:class I SAM-dependent methyltransferase [Methanospirillum lacunae]|uniref:SAM-dependent methyltransferase n=1 Tax=Methanospirillum lacunae TaxID=668570 RepID=A0A2V2N867_9EURY|nr:class I SAM-dependent methyltransferase [Methanospirillum lacunae]PWR73886.1 SAM-dependent methyltransferase [Methanospirillum lacunae]